MLSPEEKKEMLADGRSEKRRNDFARSRSAVTSRRYSLDETIALLDQFHKTFSPSINTRPTKTEKNKL